ncbi:MAG: GntR family transcriptional regulator [Pararhodobacter sp.]|nr:GntR family transcriptional regulator [Pararhodobacter sp.]
MPQDERPVAQPLHQQVRDLLMARITSGEWGPGTYLPPEIRLAESLGVAVGTLRKALLELARDGVVVRRQGKGTVVSSHDSDAALFRFFNLRRPDGSRLRPESRVLTRSCRPAEAAEATALGLNKGARVICITRLREGDGAPIIFEQILLDAARFGELETRPELLPNTLYQLYQTRFGATVHRAREQVVAVSAEGRCAAALGLAPGTPLLRIRRIALDYAGMPLELRLSWVHTSAICYQTEI